MSSSLRDMGRLEFQMSLLALRQSWTGPHVHLCCCLRYAKKLAGSCTRQAILIVTYEGKGFNQSDQQRTCTRLTDLEMLKGPHPISAVSKEAGWQLSLLPNNPSGQCLCDDNGVNAVLL